jgi:GNAT superfamily N-acetyltransferase
MRIDPVAPSDERFEQVVALFEAYRLHYDQHPHPDAARTWLTAQLTDQRLTAHIAMRDGQVRGLITCAVVPAALLLGVAWSVRDLFVDPGHRRTGVARALLQHAIDRARAAGALRLSLQTEPDNAAALALYTSLGFEPVTGVRTLSRPTI